MRRALLLLTLLVVALPFALVGASFLALDDRPLVARPAALGPAQVERAKRLLDDNDPRRLKPGAQRTVSLSQQDPDLPRTTWPAATRAAARRSPCGPASRRSPRRPSSRRIRSDAS